MSSPGVGWLRLAMIRETNRPEWVRKIREALIKHGNIPDASADPEIDVGKSTLGRWILKNPELREGITLRGPGVTKKSKP